jgi:molecular chaperone GrpE (heat shock protein)
MNDKEKLKEILRMIDDLERYADSHSVRVNTFSTKELKKSLQKIRDVLES